jgi:DNA-binding response OmpR family regulator
MNILFVDDENLICLSFKMMIEKYTGHTVICAFTVSEALAEITEHPFDILVTDYQLPDSTGAELVKTIRRMGIEIPVIAISGYFTDEIRDEMSGYGVSHYINKPFYIEELLYHLNDVSPSVNG